VTKVEVPNVPAAEMLGQCFMELQSPFSKEREERLDYDEVEEDLLDNVSLHHVHISLMVF